MITLVYSNKAWKYTANPQNRTTSYGYLNTNYDIIPSSTNINILDPFYHYLTIFHELGHIHNNHPPRNQVKGKEVIDKEIEAWEYALKCIKNSLIEKAKLFILYVLLKVSRKILREDEECYSYTELFKKLEGI